MNSNAIDYFYCALFSTFAGNEVFAIPRRSPFPKFPLQCKSMEIGIKEGAITFIPQHYKAHFDLNKNITINVFHKFAQFEE